MTPPAPVASILAGRAADSVGDAVSTGASGAAALAAAALGVALLAVLLSRRIDLDGAALSSALPAARLERPG